VSHNSPCVLTRGDCAPRQLSAHGLYVFRPGPGHCTPNQVGPDTTLCSRLHTDQRHKAADQHADTDISCVRFASCKRVISLHTGTVTVHGTPEQQYARARCFATLPAPQHLRGILCTDTSPCTQCPRGNMLLVEEPSINVGVVGCLPSASSQSSRIQAPVGYHAHWLRSICGDERSP